MPLSDSEGGFTCRFVFLPLLYELVTGELKDWEVAPVFSDLLDGTGVKFVQGQVSFAGAVVMRNHVDTTHNPHKN